MISVAYADIGHKDVPVSIFNLDLTRTCPGRLPTTGSNRNIRQPRRKWPRNLYLLLPSPAARPQYHLFHSYATRDELERNGSKVAQSRFM